MNESLLRLRTTTTSSSEAERSFEEYEYQNLTTTTKEDVESSSSSSSQQQQQQKATTLLLNMPPLLNAFKVHSLFIGLLIGFFVQFSTLGANFLVIVFWDQNQNQKPDTETETDEILSKNKTQVILLSLLWSAFTSFMAILTLGFLRSVVTIVYKASLPQPPQGQEPSSSSTSIATNADHHHHDEILQEVIFHLECRFVVGALIGVCSAWTVMDVFLGMNIQIIFSLMTLAIALIWCKIMMHCFMMKDDTDNDDDDEENATNNHGDGDEKQDKSTILLV